MAFCHLARQRILDGLPWYQAAFIFDYAMKFLRSKSDELKSDVYGNAGLSSQIGEFGMKIPPPETPGFPWDLFRDTQGVLVVKAGQMVWYNANAFCNITSQF